MKEKLTKAEKIYDVLETIEIIGLEIFSYIFIYVFAIGFILIGILLAITPSSPEVPKYGFLIIGFSFLICGLVFLFIAIKESLEKYIGDREI